MSRAHCRVCGPVCVVCGSRGASLHFGHQMRRGDHFRGASHSQPARTSNSERCTFWQLRRSGRISYVRWRISRGICATCVNGPSVQQWYICDSSVLAAIHDCIQPVHVFCLLNAPGLLTLQCAETGGRCFLFFCASAPAIRSAL